MSVQLATPLPTAQSHIMARLRLVVAVSITVRGQNPLQTKPPQTKPPRTKPPPYITPSRHKPFPDKTPWTKPPPYIIPSRQSISGQNTLINDTRQRVTCLNSTFIMLVIIKYLVCIYIFYIPNYIYILYIYNNNNKKALLPYSTSILK